MTRAETWTWWIDGEDLLAELVARLRSEEWDHPSLLPGWSRRTVIAHLARNAEALVNLLSWARTGVPTPMYADADQRVGDIVATAAQPIETIRAALSTTVAQLRLATNALEPAQWEFEVSTAQGRTVPASEVIWMRAREVWVHGVDLRCEVTFADAPRGFLRALVNDVISSWIRRGICVDGRFVAEDTGDVWTGSVTDRTTVKAPLAEIAAQVTGRAPSRAVLPPWL
jgi:maleylpyruvate isomerase